jgi:pyrroloquinoline-quinone synthase
MEKILRDLHLLNHPFYRDWMEGKLTAAQLQDYAQQYHHHVEAFPRYLGAIHSLCEDASTRRILLENLNDEEGVTHGEPHPELWRKFAEGMGVQDIRAARPRPAIQNVIDTFFSCSRSTLAEGLGALYAYEWQVPEIAESKLDGLKNRYRVEKPETLAFFEAHRTADVYHREALRTIIESMPEKEKALAKAAAERAARSLWDFLTDVHKAPTLASA